MGVLDILASAGKFKAESQYPMVCGDNSVWSKGH